jgi:hypothetical protein
MIGTACILLASKSCNQLIFLDDLVKVILNSYYDSDTKSTDEVLIEECKNKINEIEFDILTTIGFDVNVDLPYKYLTQMKPYFLKLKNFNNKLYQYCCFFINDSFTLPVCLYFNPLLIALSSINLLAQRFNLQLDSLNSIKWYHIIDETIDFSEIERLSNIIGCLYHTDESVNLLQVKKDNNTKISTSCNKFTQSQNHNHNQIKNKEY